MTGHRSPGPLCGFALGPGWIDRGTSCLHRSPTPGPLGIDVETVEVLPRTAPAQAANRSRTRELSGIAWAGRFPTSTDIDDLAMPFRDNVKRFVAAISEAGGSVAVSATRRPAERAYLMHWCYRLADHQIGAKDIPERAGVDIEWDHGLEPASVNAAKAMRNAYNIVYLPSLSSSHIAGLAIDMTVSGILGKSIRNQQRRDVLIKSAADLHAVGASYGVHKLLSDPPHWSHDGH